RRTAATPGGRAPGCRCARPAARSAAAGARPGRSRPAPARHRGRHLRRESPARRGRGCAAGPGRVRPGRGPMVSWRRYLPGFLEHYLRRVTFWPQIRHIGHSASPASYICACRGRVVRLEGAMAQTIALVDDDRNILTSVAMSLESEGYEVRT